MQDQIPHVTIIPDMDHQEENDQNAQYLQPKKPINVKRIVLIVLLSIAFIASFITGCLFGIIIGVATFCSFGISIAILYPFCGTLLNNIINPRPPKRRIPKHKPQANEL